MARPDTLTDSAALNPEAASTTNATMHRPHGDERQRVERATIVEDIRSLALVATAPHIFRTRLTARP